MKRPTRYSKRFITRARQFMAKEEFAKTIYTDYTEFNKYIDKLEKVIDKAIDYIWYLNSSLIHGDNDAYTTMSKKEIREWLMKDE